MIAASGLALVDESALAPASCAELPPISGIRLKMNRVNGDPVASKLCDLVAVQEEAFSTLLGRLYFTRREVEVPGRTFSIGCLQ